MYAGRTSIEKEVVGSIPTQVFFSHFVLIIC